MIFTLTNTHQLYCHVKKFKTIRVTLALLILLPFTSHQSAVAQATLEDDAVVPQVRMSISEVTNNAPLLAAFTRAVDTMKDNSLKTQDSVEFRTSFQFWANTHGYFGPDDAPYATNFQDVVSFRKPQCLSFFQAAPYNFDATRAENTCQQFIKASDRSFIPDQYSENIWGTCQHSPRRPPPTAPTFLPWHRLYLHYFERTLRKYSGDAGFALPFWNYFDYQDAATSRLYLPPVVTGESGNTFYDGMRTLGLNQGLVTMDPSFASAEDAFGESGFAQFSNALEGTPHGMMHCAVGNFCTTAHIGWVPVAGNDPIFYMHHANIDRLWQCWLDQKAQGDKIDLAWAKNNLGMPDSWYETSYDFVDENGDRVTKTIADAFDENVIPVYSNYDNCPDIPVEVAEVASFTGVSESKNLQLDNVKLQSKAISVEVEPVEESAESLTAMSAQQANLGAGVYLILDNIKVNKIPHFTYVVFVSNKAQPARREQVTAFNFFGFGEHGGAHGGEQHSVHTLGSEIHLISDDLEKLGIMSTDDVLIHFVPINGVTGEAINAGNENPITIEKISIRVVQ